MEGGFGRTMLWLIAIVGAIGGILYLTVFDVWKIPADDAQLAASIEPVLSSGDVVLVLRHGTPEPGNLVRCVDPDQPARFVVARVVAGAHETMVLSPRTISIDKKLLPHLRGCEEVTMKNPANGLDVKLNCSVEDTRGTEHPILVQPKEEGDDDTTTTTIETGKVFLASDNRYMHVDSRDYGQVAPTACKQIVFRLYGDSGWFDTKKRMTFFW